jgi:hypothetical protein
MYNCIPVSSNAKKAIQKGLGSGASLRLLLLPLMWCAGGVLLPGLWRQQLLQLAWLLLCCMMLYLIWCGEIVMLLPDFRGCPNFQFERVLCAMLACC